MRPSVRSLLAATGMALLISCATGARTAVAADDPTGPTPEKPTVAPAPAPTAPATPAVSGLPISDAIEGILDEDEPTRKAAFARLDLATAADIPALEKYVDAKDPEVFKQVHLILKRLKRGDLAFQASFPDGTPVAGAKFNVRVFMANQVQVFPNGRTMMVQWKQPRNGMADPLISGEYTSDATGRFSVGRYNDGEYLCLIEATDPLPQQTINRTVPLKQSTETGKLEVKRGVTATVTVTDADGVAMVGAQVVDVENEGWLNNIQNQNVFRGNGLINQCPNAETDEKGVAVLEKIGMHPIHLVAVKEGYDTLLLPDQHWEDGGKIEASAKLVKTKPVHVKMKISTQKQKGLAEARVLLVPQMKQVMVMGGNWATASVKDIDSYIEKGGLDFKTTDDKGEVAGDVLPDQFMVFCFVGTKLYYGNCQVQRGNADASCNVMVQEIPNQGR